MFCSPAAPSAPAKLRMLYECAPLAFVVEAAGGSSHCGVASVLEQTIKSANERSVISLGSKEEVEQTKVSLRYGQEH